jgi:hypothetical protein
MISRLSQAELATVYDNMTGLGNIPLDQFQILYKYATQERFKFLNIDIIGGGVLYKNFDKIEWADKKESKKQGLKRQAAQLERRELKKRAREILTSKGVLLS